MALGIRPSMWRLALWFMAWHSGTWKIDQRSIGWLFWAVLQKKGKPQINNNMVVALAHEFDARNRFRLTEITVFETKVSPANLYVFFLFSVWNISKCQPIWSTNKLSSENVLHFSQIHCFACTNQDEWMEPIEMWANRLAHRVTEPTGKQRYII